MLVLAAYYVDNDTAVTPGGFPMTTQTANIVSSDDNNLTVSSRTMTSGGVSGFRRITNVAAGMETNAAQFGFRRSSLTPGAARGAVVTRTPIADVTDMDIYQNRVITRNEDSAPLSIANMTSFDSSDDSDIPFTATGGPNTLSVRAGSGLYVWDGDTFAPGGNITLNSSGNGFLGDGTLTIGDGATFTAAGTQTHSIGGSFFNKALSTFNSASSTVIFTATTTGKGITQDSGDTLLFNELQFTGSGGGWNSTADIEAAENMFVSAGTVTGTGDITIRNGELSGAGLLSMGGGTTTLKTTNTLGGAQGWTFFDLVLGDGSTTGTTTRSNAATTTVANKLIISPAHYLSTGSSVWNLSGIGKVFEAGGTLLQDTSTFIYSGGGAVDVLSTNYYNLQFGGAAGAPDYQFSSTGVLIENNLRVGGLVSSIVNLNTNDPVVSVLGDVLITQNGNLNLSNTTDFTISGSYDNNATLTANAGTIIFDSADAYSIAAGGSDFSDVTLSGSGAATVSENATSTGLFLIATSSDFTQQPGTTLAVGGQLTIESATTDWTGSTLSLYGGGDYLVNNKDITENFENLVIAAGTEIRTWNSDAVTQTVDPAG
jgi:hypothetical protein